MPLKTDDDFKLSPELIEDIAGRLHPNEVVTNLKLLNSKAAAALRGSYSTIRLERRKPLPSRNVYIACAETWPGDGFARHWGRPEPWRSLPLPRRLRLLCLAASSHHPPSLDAALAHSGVGLAPAVIEAAAAAGDLDAFLRLVSEGCDCAMAALEAAAHCGQLHVLQWVWEELEPGLQLRQAFGCGPDEVGELAMSACAGGQGHVLTWLESLADPPAQPPPTAAAAGAAGAAAMTGSKHSSSSGGLEHVRVRAESLEECFFAMANQAAVHGRTGLLDRLLQPGGRYVDAFKGLANYKVKDLFLHIGSFCPLATLQHYHAAWVPHVSEEDMAVAALRGTTADWREKCDCMLKKLAAALEEERAAAAAMGQQAGGGVLEGPAALVVRVARWYMQKWGQVAEYWTSLGLPDFMERMRYLTALGLPSGEWEPQVATALAFAGNAVALRQLLDEWDPAAAGSEGSEWQCQHGYHVPMLELLVERFGAAGAFGLENIITAGESNRMPALQYLVNTWVQAHGGGQQDGSGSNSIGIAAGSGDDGDWDEVFSCAAGQGADLSLLRLLHERCGAAIDLAAVAAGGSEDSIQWAVGTLRAARRDASLTADQVWRIAGVGNLAAAAWVLDHGLLSPRGRALPHPADCPCISAFTPDDECGDSEPRPSYCIRLWVARRAMAAAAAAPAGSRAHQAKEWVRLEEFVEKLVSRQRMRHHQKAWLRRQLPQELQQAVAAYEEEEEKEKKKKKKPAQPQQPQAKVKTRSSRRR